MKKFVTGFVLICALASSSIVFGKDVKVFKKAGKYSKIIQIDGAAAQVFYDNLNAEEETLSPVTNLGKRVLDEEGDPSIYCIKYTKAPLSCSILLK